MRYFRLLEGTHQEDDNRIYRATVKRDEKGNVTGKNQPIVPSQKDLVAVFGPGKFVEIASDDPSIEVLTIPEEVATDESKTATSSIQQAVEKGAEGIQPKLGKDVTEKFPIAKEAKLKVFMKPGGKYSIIGEDGGLLTGGGPLPKDQVTPFIEDYLEN